MTAFLSIGSALFGVYVLAFLIPGFFAGAIVGLVHACRRPSPTAIADASAQRFARDMAWGIEHAGQTYPR